MSRTLASSRWSKSGAALALASVCWLGANDAHGAGQDQATSTAKGTVGGMLLGAEVVLLTEAAFGVKPWWAYAVGGGAGAIGGGVAGYFLERSIDPKASMLMLAAGMALVIPTTVLTLNATAYEPPVDYLQDGEPLDGADGVADPVPIEDAPSTVPESATEPQPATDPESPEPDTTEPETTDPQPATESRPSGRRHPTEARRSWNHATLPGLLDYRVGYLTLRVPAVSVQNVFTTHELQQYGLAQETELNVRVVNLVF